MPNLLVTTDWLADHINDANLHLIDIRGHVLPASAPKPHYFNHRADYDHSHLPGAVFIDWVLAITDPADPRHAQIAPPERFGAAMREAGIDAGTQVIAYDDAQGMFAARLWWALNYYGHRQIAVLDGGWQKWIAEGRATTAAIPDLTPGNFTAQPQPDWIRSANQVADRQPGESVLIDARTPAEFAGQASRAARSGHIPGAVNQSRGSLVSADGTLRPPTELRTHFAQIGVDASTSEAVFYCNGGVSASFGLLALRAAGLTVPSAVYDGSWKEWGSDATRPIA